MNVACVLTFFDKYVDCGDFYVLNHGKVAIPLTFKNSNVLKLPPPCNSKFKVKNCIV